MRRQWFYFLIISVLLLCLDQLSKVYVERFITPGQSLVVIDNFFHLTLIHNSGGAFGIFRSSHPLLFITISALAIILILCFWKKLPAEGFAGRLYFGFILGGATGNLVDRLRLGYVVDFLDFSFRGHHWPAFNLADFGISVGTIIFCYKMLKHQTEEKQELAMDNHG